MKCLLAAVAAVAVGIIGLAVVVIIRVGKDMYYQ